MEKLKVMTISEIGSEIEAKKISPVEVLETLLERIEKYENTLNTFITLMINEAREQAKQAEADILAGNYKGPLHGIPISLKDIIAYADVPMTDGSRVNPDFVPSYHATVTQKLVDAGAVIVGKAHLHEFAYKAPHPYYGWTKNPWDLRRVPGGSSSGSGSAVQAGFVLGSIGTDTGGSIRMPASLCGVVGLKPTYGRVSRFGVSPLSWTLDHVGPLTRTCEDAAIMFQAIAGYDPKDETSYGENGWNLEEFNKMESLKGKKIGLLETFIFDNLPPEIEHSFRSALSFMENQGAEIIPLEIEGLEELRSAHRIILNSEAYSFHQHNLENKSEGYGPTLRPAFEIGQYYSAESYIQAQRIREEMVATIQEVFEKVDVLLTPTFPEVAPKIESYEKDFSFARGKFTFLANILGLPALSLPSGYSSENLPIGLQFIGAPYKEGEILSIGHQYEQITGHYKVLPNEAIWEA